MDCSADKAVLASKNFHYPYYSNETANYHHSHLASTMPSASSNIQYENDYLKSFSNDYNSANHNTVQFENEKLYTKFNLNYNQQQQQQDYSISSDVVQNNYVKGSTPKLNQENSYESLSMSSTSSTSSTASSFNCITTSNKVLDYTNLNENQFKTQTVQDQFTPQDHIDTSLAGTQYTSTTHAAYNHSYNWQSSDNSNNQSVFDTEQKNFTSPDMSYYNQYKQAKQFNNEHAYQDTNVNTDCSSWNPLNNKQTDQNYSNYYNSSSNFSAETASSTSVPYSYSNNYSFNAYSYHNSYVDNSQKSQQFYNTQHDTKPDIFWLNQSDANTNSSNPYDQSANIKNEKILHKTKVTLKEEYEIETTSACSTCLNQNMDSCETCKNVYRNVIEKTKKFKDKKSNRIEMLVHSTKSAKNYAKLIKNSKKLHNSDKKRLSSHHSTNTSKQVKQSSSQHYKNFIRNEMHNAEFVHNNYKTLINSIKLEIYNKKTIIREQLHTSTATCQLTVQQFKNLIGYHLIELTQNIVNCIVKYVTNSDTIKPITNLYSNNVSNEHLNKILVLAYVYLVDNIENFLFEFNTNYSFNQTSLDSIYKNVITQSCDDGNVAGSSGLFYSDTSKSADKYQTTPLYYQNSYDTKVQCQITCTVSEMKMLHFILVLFTQFITYENCALTNGSCLSLIQMHQDQNESSNSVGVSCLKIVKQLIDQLCFDKLVKRKILLNLTEFDDLL